MGFPPTSEALLFCPNCGTKNPETATTCTKCGFNIKGAAAPKFKGTMLMTNQPAGAPKPGAAAVPPPAAAPPPAGPTAVGAAGPPAPAAAPPAAPKPNFKGTMVGVAPQGGFGLPAPQPAAAQPIPQPAAAPQPAAGAVGYGPTMPAPVAPQQQGGFPAPGGGYVPPAQPQGFGTPGPVGGQAVNPLGGTVAIDQMGAGFAAAPAGAPGGQSPPAYGAPPAGYGAPPQGGYGAPPQGWGTPNDPGMGGPPAGPGPGGPPAGYGPPQGGYGAPPAGYGPPAGAGYGAPPGGPGYGAPPGAGYGAPGGGYGAPQGAPPGYGAPQGGYGPGAYGQPGGAMVQAGAGALAPGGYAQPAGTARGPIRNPVMVTVLTMVTCGLYGIFTFYSMMSELKAYLNRQEIVPWHIFVPILGIIVMLGKLPGWVTEAKQRAGSRNPQSSGPVLYFLLFPYFFTKDMNDVWDPSGASA